MICKMTVVSLCLVLGLTGSHTRGQTSYAVRIGGNDYTGQTIPITTVGNDDGSALVCYTLSEQDNSQSRSRSESESSESESTERFKSPRLKRGRRNTRSRSTRSARHSTSSSESTSSSTESSSSSTESSSSSSITFRSTYWTYPNGRRVLVRNYSTASFFSLKQSDSISLYRNKGVLSPTGRFCCGSRKRKTRSERACVTLVVDCGQPPKISNGSSGTPNQTTFGGTVTYSCNNGFVLSGPPTVTCQVSGRWSTQPNCTAILVEVVPQSNLPLVGQNFSFNCSVSGAVSLNSTFNYQWFKEAANQTELQIGEEAILVIDSLVLSDVGQYRCVVNISSTVQSHVVISDGYDLQFQILNIQLRFNGILNCRQYTSTEALQKTNDITNGLVEAIESRCRCGFNSTLLSNAFLRCFDEDSPHHVTYRAMMTATDNTTTVEMVSVMKEWLTTNSRMIVQTVQLGINSTCPVAIADLYGPECSEAIDTQSTVTAATPITTRFPPYAGGVIASVLAIVAIVAVVVATTLFTLKRRSNKKQTKVKKQEPPHPEPDSSHQEQNDAHDYEDMELDAGYELVGLPHPFRGSYDVTSCPAYVPGMDVSGGRGKTSKQVTPESRIYSN